MFFAFALLLFFWWMGSTASSELDAKGLVPTFTFLDLRSGFEISESPDWYSGDSTYGQAFVVGMINTLRVVILGLIFASILGFLIGVFLLSRNWLIRSIARVYVEIMRNTPLLLQIFTWYFIVMFSLPQIRAAITFPNEGVTFISLRLALWALLWLVLWRYWRGPGCSIARRGALQYGFTALVLTSELAAYGHFELSGWPWPWGAGITAAFLLYALVSVALVFAALRFTPTNWRARALGLSLGQSLAGALFSLGVLPMAALRLELQPALFLSIRGAVFPELLPTARFASWFAYVALGLLLSAFIWVWLGRRTEITGQPYPRAGVIFLSLLAFAVVGWLLVTAAAPPTHVPIESAGTVEWLPREQAEEEGLLSTAERLRSSQQPLIVQLPTQNRFGRFNTGLEFTPEYMALLIALVIYTSSFIAEIVRAGIQAVDIGQLEAGRALGLSQTQLLARIIFPQALRIIIPPLGNQYLNLSKNSSLAISVAYADTFNITSTIMNQSGQTITGFFIVMIFYLLLSLVISVIMNAMNQRFELVTR